MIKEIIKDEDYHENGNLSYIAHRAVIVKGYEHLYVNRRMHPDGYSWVYQGLSGKWDKKGKQRWRIDYNNFGEPLV